MNRIFIFLCSVFLAFALCCSPVLASSNTSHGGGSGSHEIEEDSGHGGSGGNHAVSPVTVEDIMQPFVLLWKWMVATRINVAGFSFSFADRFIFAILASIAVWFLAWNIYDR